MFTFVEAREVDSNIHRTLLFEAPEDAVKITQVFGFSKKPLSFFKDICKTSKS